MSPRIVSSLTDVSADYDAILCDIWGVLHDGKAAFPAAAAALARYRGTGGVATLITNAPRPSAPIQAQLDRLGVARDAYDSIVTSGDVTLALIEARGEAPAHHIGPERDLSLYDAVAARTGRRPALVGPEAAAYAICTGLEHDHVETPEDYRARLTILAERKLPFVCANPELVIHRGADLVYCAGALAQIYEALGGEVTYAGKPFAPIYDAALAACAARLGRPPRRVLAIGDGFRTDVAGARAAGLDVLFVAGGIHRDEAMNGGGVAPEGLAALFAREGYTPAATIAALV
ncbi:MAG: TIGR01459 family HAD-type hydrolase [Pseudomonadota bacterium]|nr:TIGR01459 family HAD-type hydrolase [Pseudomonadota bacterium]